MSTSITELFSRNPLEHTDEDIDRIIAAYREKRKLWKANPAQVAAKTPKLTDAQKQADALNLDIKL